ncbi:hypothetical protein [Cytobacillus purgationiresistens]|uniref:F0F1-type ATP synthase n=1 Tax=Cytobacillus purgationiresistens TaxID=863449 RepID=A0ABU0AK19_9BACI|nr:hypothetical protein [Cytobacillus purgationiresistens]MDQ0271219.1 hypothetical protein [Cytobacillus purgationiresistens]
MKITNWTIIFVIVLIPLMFNLHLKDTQTSKAQNLSMHYNNVLTSAVMDASASLLENVEQEFESGYASAKYTSANKDAAIDTFLKTLSLNFAPGNDQVSRDVIKSYIPLILLVDYRGYYVYSWDDFINEKGEVESDLVPRPFKPYVYHDNKGNILSFTLDDYVIAFDKVANKWEEGYREEIKDSLNIPLLQDDELFENIRRTTILNAIQDDAQYYINHHNTYAARLGITYTFTLPILSKEDWQNTIDDIGLLSFIQGVPLVGGGTYNNYALSTSKIAKANRYIATEVDGSKFYYLESCDFNYPAKELFTSPKEAAKKGYKPLSCFNKVEGK